MDSLCPSKQELIAQSHQAEVMFIEGGKSIINMKQLDIYVSPPAFVWNPYMTLPNVTFNLDPCDL